MKPKVLIVGFGSIGRKHAKAFIRLSCAVGIVSEHCTDWAPRFSSLAAAIDSFDPDIIVISSKTSHHARDLFKVLELGFSGKILVEKPIFSRPLELTSCQASIFVGYNLRFHPCITFLRKEIERSRTYSVLSYCGQYLPDWRPGTDYTQCYSAKRSEGGGVLRDLSHELDLYLHLFGKVVTVKSFISKMSQLAIDSEDNCSGLLKMESGTVITFNLNYMDRNTKRAMTINSSKFTYEVDLIQNRVVKNNKPINFEVSSLSTYALQAHDLIYNGGNNLCRLEEGLSVLELISDIEKEGL